MSIKSGVSPRTHYACEECGNPVHRDDAETRSFPSIRGAVVVAVCPRCEQR